MFPMVPFANCIRDNEFSFEESTYRVSPNMDGAALNFHGSGWLLPWTIVERDSALAVLRLDDARVDDAYRFDAEQDFVLDPDGLTVTLAVTNRGPRRMPFSFGLHPWFPRHGRTMLRFTADGFWTEGENGVAGDLTAVPTDGDYRAGRTVPMSRQNNCHAGWDGTADIAWPDRAIGLRVEADPIFPHLMFHVPSGGAPTFCIEPQSNAPCAFDGLETGHVQTGVFLLNPGEAVGGKVRFRVVAPADYTREAFGPKGPVAA
jgi:aldose 1-epimerase